MLLWKAKLQYPFTWGVSRYCLLALQGRIMKLCTTIKNRYNLSKRVGQTTDFGPPPFAIYPNRGESCTLMPLQGDNKKN